MFVFCPWSGSLLMKTLVEHKSCHLQSSTRKRRGRYYLQITLARHLTKSWTKSPHCGRWWRSIKSINNILFLFRYLRLWQLYYVTIGNYIVIFSEKRSILSSWLRPQKSFLSDCPLPCSETAWKCSLPHARLLLLLFVAQMLLCRWTRFDMDVFVFSNTEHNIYVKFQTYHSVFGIRCYNIYSSGGPENKLVHLNLAQVWMR
jgi:hypothetical protein